MRWPLPKYSHSRRRSVLGMDIGADGVRLVLVSAQRDRLSIEWAEEVSLTELQGFADYDSVRAKLEGVLASRLRGTIEVATVPPWNSARVVIEEMPAMDGPRFAKAATWYFSRNRHEDMLDPVDLGIAQAPRTTVEGKNVLDGMMVSMDKVMLSGLSDLCASLRLTLAGLYPAPSCHAALLSRAASEHRQALVLDIGAGQTRMTLSSAGNVRLVRKLKPSANELVRELCESLGVGWEDANHALLAASGIGPLARHDAQGLAARAMPIVQKNLDRLAGLLIGEIERSAAYVQARHGEAVDRVLIAGGLGGAPALIERLARDSHLQIVPFDPFEWIAHDFDVPHAVRPSFALAVGAAILSLQREHGANLLAADKAPAPEKRRAQRKVEWPARRVAATAAAVGICAGVGMFEWKAQALHGRLRNDMDALYAEREQLRLTAHELTRNSDLFDLQDRIESLRGIYRSRHLYTPFFARVVGCLPEGMQLDAISVRRGDEVAGENGSDAQARPRLDVVVSGHTDDVDAIGGFVVVLERAELLHHIQVLRIHQRTADGSARGFDFELQGEPFVQQQSEVLAAAERQRAADEPEVAR